MTQQKHTPEPWRAPGIGEVCDESGRCIGIMIDYANARRVVACINACAGISTDVLELGRVSPDAFELEESRADKAEQQRDQLRAALEAIADPHRVPSHGDPSALREYASAALVAIKRDAK